MFDDMIVPWERISLLDDVELGNRTVVRVALWRHYMQQVAVKNIAKLEFILGITTGVYGHVQEKTAEIIDTSETCRAYMRDAEADAATLEGAEAIWPAPEPWIAMRHWKSGRVRTGSGGCAAAGSQRIDIHAQRVRSGQPR